MGNYLSDCNSGKLRIDPKSFQQTWCVRCSRPDCDFAQFARDDPMAIRQATWRERYFGDNQADLDVPAFARIAAIDFPDLMRKAVRLEISERRGDWSVPEIEITDGRVVQASPDTTDQVDEAVRRLGQKEEQEKFLTISEEPLLEDGDIHPGENETPFIEEEMEVSGTSTHPPENKGSHHPPSRAPRPTARNVPDRGEVMLGGAPVPIKRSLPTKEHDPWASPPKPKHVVVKAGATIILGGKT